MTAPIPTDQLKGPAASVSHSSTSDAPDFGRRAPVLLEVMALFQRIIEPLLIVILAIITREAFGDAIPEANDAEYFRAAMLTAVFYAGLAEAIGAYDVDVRFSIRNGLGRVVTALFGTAMIALTVGFFLKVSEEYSRLWVVTWLVSSGVGLGLARAGTTFWLRGTKAKGLFNQRVAIFGTGEQGERLARYIKGNERLTIDLIGFFDDRTDERSKGKGAILPLRGTLQDLVQQIRRGNVDQVILALPWSAEIRLQDIVQELAVTPVRIRLAPDLASFAFASRQVVLLGDLPVMTLFERPISGMDRIIKRIEDFALLIVLLPIAIPVLLLAALAIRIDSPGPIFFRQEREGFNNKRFNIWKFRSMRIDALEFDAINQASKEDPRITRVGRFLRRTSIDELPQLFNVLTGEMSLVGPRPHAPSTRAGNRFFGDIVDTYAARHNVKPGMSGWAQVNGHRGETDTEEKLIRRLEHDLHYIENWSVGFDLYILMRTGWALLFPKNAY